MPALRSALAALAAAGLSLAVVALEDPRPGDLSAAEEGEECAAGGGGSEECGLSLRQLRARGVAGATAATAAAAATADAVAAPPSPMLVPSPKLVPSPAVPAAEDPTEGVPGGWGEAATFASAVREEEAQNPTLKTQWSDFDDDGWDSRKAGSCAAYGCLHSYAPWNACQCNHDCAKYGSCCSDYWHKCHHSPAPAWTRPAPAPHHSRGKKVMTLYHQTGQHAANLIKKYGFKPGHGGWCGGAIYFATSPKETFTKAIGPQSHKGAMLECQVEVGKVMYQDRRCGGHAHSEAELDRKGYDSVSFNPGDGDEYIIYDKSQVLSVKQIPI